MPRPEWQKVREIFDAAVLGRYEIRSELGEGGKVDALNLLSPTRRGRARIDR
jgi:hypothetical protein